MSFLTPLYLLGALGLSIPIILHLLHDRPKNKQEFGSLMFLDKTKPPVDRKRRPTHLLLLLLRCLALLLLAFVFARPFVTVDDPADAARPPMDHRAARPQCQHAARRFVGASQG